MTQSPAGEPPDRVDPRQLRASNADRERIAQALHEAAGEGRIDLDELQERLDSAYAARTYADLEPLLADLPPTGAGVVAPASATQPARPRPASSDDDKGGTRTVVAVLSGANRKGAWLVPRTQVAVACLGGIEIDLREAQFSTDEVTIQAYTFMGGIEITVPEWMEVHVDCAAFLGGVETRAAGPGTTTEGAPPGGGPVLRITGFAFLGGVDIKRKPPKGSKLRRFLGR